MLQGKAQRLRSSFAYPGQSQLRPNRRSRSYNTHLLLGLVQAIGNGCRGYRIENMFLRLEMERTETIASFVHSLSHCSVNRSSVFR